MENKITITISEENWKKLSNLKINKTEIKSHDDALNFLFKNCKEVKNENKKNK